MRALETIWLTLSDGTRLAARLWLPESTGPAPDILASAPAALTAVVTTCASDDRFADDMHYMGGYLLNDNSRGAFSTRRLGLTMGQTRAALGIAE